MGDVIVTKGLTKRYGSLTAVDGLDLRVAEGEIVGLLGPNGAGKTTTILMLLGLTEPTAGAIEVLGMDPRRRALEVKSIAGYLPDTVGFYEQLTGRQNLRFSARLNRLDGPAGEAAINRALDEVGLQSAADRPTGTYSRGMKQRLGIADALLKSPRLLILDEPTVSIDPAGVEEILQLIRRIADERRVSVLLSSHLLNQVEAVCDRVAIFVDGRIVAEGPPHELARTSSTTDVVELELANEGDPAAALSSCAAVKMAERSITPRTWTLRIDQGSAPEVVAAVVHAGLRVAAVRPRKDDLLHAYQEYFSKEPVNA